MVPREGAGRAGVTFARAEEAAAGAAAPDVDALPPRLVEDPGPERVVGAEGQEHGLLGEEHRRQHAAPPALPSSCSSSFGTAGHVVVGAEGPPDLSSEAPRLEVPHPHAAVRHARRQSRRRLPAHDAPRRALRRALREAPVRAEGEARYRDTATTTAKPPAAADIGSAGAELEELHVLLEVQQCDDAVGEAHGHHV